MGFIFRLITARFKRNIKKTAFLILTKYIQTAMHHAIYKLLEDSTFYGEIAGFQGVYANAETLETCRDLLQEVLEGWIILGLRLHTALATCCKSDKSESARDCLMPLFEPIRRQELIRQLEKLGFSKPKSGGNHQYMVKEQLEL